MQHKDVSDSIIYSSESSQIDPVGIMLPVVKDILPVVMLQASYIVLVMHLPMKVAYH